MFARVTLLEIDLLRIGMDDAVRLFTDDVLPGLREQTGFAGVLVLTTPEGRGMIASLWDTEEAATAAAGFASAALERTMALFAAPPGRDHYEVSVARLPELHIGPGA